jgi:hypothetical protein
MVWAWLEAVPLSTMGSRRASAVREWQGMRQKALAVPDSRAAAAMVAADLMIAVLLLSCWWDYFSTWVLRFRVQE